MKLHPRSIDDLPPGDTLLQTAEWARFKQAVGWKPLAFTIDGDAAVLVLTRRVAPLTALAYVPHGPHSAEIDLKALSAALRPHLPANVVCVRYDLPWQDRLPEPGGHGVRKAPVDVQPPSTVLVPLRDEGEQQLAEMHKKHRYNIRLAAKKGVSVRQASVAELPTWYSLYQETAARDRITIHSLAYYRRLVDSVAADAAGNVALQLWFAEHGGEPLSGIIVAYCGETATYLYGASSNNKREVMPNYAVQYGAMRSARAAGMQVYDLFGIPPSDDPAHPMYGLYRFKTGFGGAIVRRPGCWDAPLAPLRYLAYARAERLRDFYYHNLRKRRAG